MVLEMVGVWIEYKLTGDSDLRNKLVEAYREVMNMQV